MPRLSVRLLSAAAALAVLPACQTTERAANATAEGAEDAAGAVADAAGAAAGAVSDAAGSVYNTARDVFDSDDDASAVALVRPTSAPGSDVQGTVRFRESGDGLEVMVSVSGLRPGRHGIHIHENPSCAVGDADGDGRTEPGGAAGGHWDPLGTGDHGAAGEDLDDKHLGDLGNITAGADGTAEATFMIAPFPAGQTVAGRAVIVHAQADDRESDPGGSAGARLGCGVIEARG